MDILKADGGGLWLNEPVGRGLHILEIRFLPSMAYVFVSGADGCFGVDTPGLEHQRCFRISLKPENLGLDGITAVGSSWAIEPSEQEDAARYVFGKRFQKGSKSVQAALAELNPVFGNILSAIEEAFANPSVARFYGDMRAIDERSRLHRAQKEFDSATANMIALGFSCETLETRVRELFAEKVQEA